MAAGWRLGCVGKPIAGLLLGGAGLYLVVALTDPWALHIGGRSTPLMYWSGYGNLVSKNGTYPLFISFYPASHSSSQLHLDGLRPTADTRGTAWLCTGSGVVHRLSLSGTIYGGWSSTESSLMRIRLGEFRPIDLGQHTGYFDLYGRWRGPQLVMEDRGSYSSVYSFGLKVEKASVTFDWGGYSDFKTVCASTPNLRQH